MQKALRGFIKNLPERFFDIVLILVDKSNYASFLILKTSLRMGASALGLLTTTIFISITSACVM
jgi:hypothetical protein